jgi:hypothetical protein
MEKAWEHAFINIHLIYRKPDKLSLQKDAVFIGKI